MIESEPRGAARWIFIANPRVVNALGIADLESLRTEIDTAVGDPSVSLIVISGRGGNFSAGERQLLAFTRAMVAQPRILILDEATSNLDTENERLIQQSLHTLMQDRTSFVIAHRLSTISHADRIVVLEGGRIVEQGTHDELMERSGRYRRMVTIQTEPTRTNATPANSARQPSVSPPTPASISSG